MSARMALLACLCLLVLAAGSAVSGENPGDDGQMGGKSESDRWVPSITFDVLLYDWEAEGVVDTFVPDCAVNPCRSSMSGSQSNTFSSVQYRLGLEVLSPQLDFLPAAPRASVFGGVLINPQQAHSIYKTGRFIQNMPDQQIEAAFPPPFAGVGAEIKARYLETGWFVGVGAVFEVPALSSKIRFTPSVGYLRERIEVSGKLSAVNVVPPPPDAPPGSSTYPFVPVHVNVPWTKQTYHYLGPGAAIEILLIPGQRLSFSLYGQAQFLWNLDATSIVLVANSAGGTTTFTYAPDDFAVRGAIGVRLAWQGGLGF